MSCPACLGRWPPDDHKIADGVATTIYLNEDQFFPGSTILVLRRHATELYELTGEERAGLIEEVSATACALAVTFDAVKINYALLGNQIPHIHWHLIPRCVDDPAPREASFAVRHEPAPLDPAARAERITRVRQALAVQVPFVSGRR